MTHKTELSVKLPNIQELCCINCRANPEEMQHPIVKSLFHCQILTCRLIIDTVSCCIAAPSVQKVKDLIHVIVSRKFYSSGKLQQHLQQLKIQFTEPEVVHQKIYEACLRYTISFKITPHWNSIGKSFYAYGPEFLSQFNVDAILWNILLKENGDRLELTPTKLSLFPLKLEFLGLPTDIVENFKKKDTSKNPTNLMLFQCPPVYVLPKLSRGKVVSVYNAIPDCCPFANYNDLRRHWKNMYSYRLPKSHENMLFYEVVFPMKPNQRFTYPEVCLFLKTPEILMCTNKSQIAKTFIKDLQRKVPSVCGTPIKISQFHSQLEVEYSCVIKRKGHGYGDRHSFADASPSSFFGSPMGCIVKPTKTRLNLPTSNFAFRGAEKMSGNMRSHSEKILAIMNGKRTNKSNSGVDDSKKRKTALTGNNAGLDHLIVNMDDEVRPQATITDVDDTSDICSFYDIPSMKSEYLRSLNENQDKEFDDDSCKENNHRQSNCNVDNSTSNTMFRSASDLLKARPIVRSIENVSFDLAGIKAKAINAGGVRDASNAHSSDSRRRQTQTGLETSGQGLSNLDSLATKGENKEEAEKDANRELESRDARTGQNNTKNVDANELFLDERSFFSAFDAYNIHGKNIQRLQPTIYDRCRSAPCSIADHSTSLGKSGYRESLEESPQMSPSLLEDVEMAEQESFSCREQNVSQQQYSHFFDSSRYTLNSFRFKSISDQSSISVRESAGGLQQRSANATDEFGANHKDSDEPGTATNEFGANHRDSNEPGTSKDCSSLLKPKINQTMSTRNDPLTFNSCIPNQSSLNKSLCKTPSMLSMTTNADLDNSCTYRTYQSTPQLTSNANPNLPQEGVSKFSDLTGNAKSKEIPDAFGLQKYTSDFHSILSESDNESDHEKNHESYKLACQEALTFDN